MLKILIGGSPCTKWSIAQKNGRETQPNSGLGWELFLNYKIAYDKYQPDYFLYENNKSASQPIKDEIARQLNVSEPDLLTPDNGVRMTHINSALVSAQNRERFYVTNFGDIELPRDRGILLKDILEHGVVEKEKAYCLCTDHTGTTRDYFKKHQSQIVFEPVRLGSIGSNSQAHRVYSCYGKSITLSATVCGQGGKTGLYFVPLPDALVGLVCDKGKIYTVTDGRIETKSGVWNVNLPDGLYIIRKLTVNEAKRCQTIPEWYSFPVSDQQAYKMIGNGWTIEVIKYLLSKIPNILNEEIEVLSMYDGMSCGQIALEEMGCNVVRYYATEIDKYAIQTTLHNFPNTIQLGDAFQVREEGWRIGE